MAVPTRPADPQSVGVNGAYSFTQLQQLWIQAGGTKGWAPLMAAIALAESGGTPRAANTQDPYGGSYGLWQINGSHAPGGMANAGWVANMYTPLANAREAVTVGSKGSYLTPWKGDRAWAAWQEAGAPPKPPSNTVLALMRTSGISPNGAVSAHVTTTAMLLAATATGANLTTFEPGHKYSTRLPPTGRRGLGAGGHVGDTQILVTPSVIPGVSATVPSNPAFGTNPFGDLATSIRWFGEFGAWGMLTLIVLVLGIALLAVGLLLLMMILLGPAVAAGSRVASLTPVGAVRRAVAPAHRARRIAARTALATAKAKKATRDAATAVAKRVPRSAQRAPAGRRRPVEERPFTDADTTPRLKTPGQRRASRDRQPRRGRVMPRAG